MKFRFVACPQYTQFSIALDKAIETNTCDFRFEGVINHLEAQETILKYPDLKIQLDNYSDPSSRNINEVIRWEYLRILEMCELLKLEAGLYPIFTSVNESLEGQDLLNQAGYRLKSLNSIDRFPSLTSRTNEVLDSLTSYVEHEAQWLALHKYDFDQGYTEANARVFTARSYGLNLHDVRSLIYDYYDSRSPYYSVMGRQLLEKGAKEILESVFG